MRGLSSLVLLLGIAAGFGVGLFVAWYLLPVSFADAQPYDLTLHDKEDYARMIAASYAVENDFALAHRRLYYLQLPDQEARLAELARTEQSARVQQALVNLLLALRQPSLALARPTFTPRPTRDRSPAVQMTVIVAEPTPVPTPQATPLPLATEAPDASLPRFELSQKRALGCEEHSGEPSLQVEVQDAEGRGLAGVGILARSERGNELFYTGFKPESGPGYADLRVQPGVYSVQLVETAASEVVADLRIDADVVECSSIPTVVRGWRLVFRKVP